jgi:hypothetical protein
MTKRSASDMDIAVAAYEALLSRNGGRVGPSDVLDEARDPASPLHDLFEWDNDEAGERYRLAQASALIRRWKGSVMKIDAEAKVVRVETVRRVQSPAGLRSAGGRSYMPVEEIMANPETRDDMIKTVLRELSAYRKRYADLVALADVWAAIDDAVELHTPEILRAKPEADVRPAA